MCIRDSSNKGKCPDGVLHCWTGTPNEMKQFLDLGFYISFSGIVTFPKAHEIHECAKIVPNDKYLIETDSPFLAPVPHRGKRNEPAFVENVAKFMADLRSTELITIAKESSKNAEDLYRLLSDSYLENKDMASATRHLVNSLFSKYGLVVLDADSPNLKKEAIPLIKRDVLEQSNYPLIQNTNQGLGEVQAYVRPINFFYLQKGSRNRIEQQGSDFIVCNSDLKFSKEALLSEIENHPERFSPNVLLRPLFKEFILPNLAMIGGGAEVNYWMQLKSTFSFNKIVSVSYTHLTLPTNREV